MEELSFRIISLFTLWKISVEKANASSDISIIKNVTEIIEIRCIFSRELLESNLKIRRKN